MNTEYTPGPWITEHVGDCVEVVNEETLFTIARCGIKNGARSEANARLIAAAPELLEALEDVLSSEPGPSLNDRVRAAIAKALGGTSGGCDCLTCTCQPDD